ncbi:hypothetical protein BB561_006723, partial [Smittium simulii]
RRNLTGRSRIQQGQQDQSIQTDPVDVELPHVVARAPVTDLIYYPELLGVNTLGNVMHYTPPTLIDTASVTAKKENPDITFALEVRLLLADAAPNITQLRRELVYKTMDLPGRAPKLAEKTNDSLFEPETIKYDPSRRTSLYVLSRMSQAYRQSMVQQEIVEKKRALQILVIELFPLSSLTFISPLTTHPHRYKRKLSKKASIAILEEISKPVYNSKENRQSKTSTGSEETKLLRSGQKLQDGIPDICMQNDQEERLHDIFRSRGCVSTHPYTLKLHGIQKVDRNWIQDQQQEIIDDPHTINRTLRNTFNSRSMTFKVPPNKIRDLRREAAKLLRIGKTTLKGLVSFIGKAQAMSVALLPETFLGYNNGEEHLFWIMEKKIHKGKYQLQGTINNTKYLKNIISNRKINSDIPDNTNPLAFVKKRDSTSNTDQASKIRSSKNRRVQDSVRTEKQKITTNQEQDIVFNSVENQRKPYKKKISLI